jgi:hypothetical protein
MMHEQPMGQVLDFPHQDIWEVQPFPADHVAEVSYLRPEYEPIQEPVGTLAKVLPFERQRRAEEHDTSTVASSGFSHDANTRYISRELAPPSQENIETTTDVLTYMRDMYDYYAKQTWAFDNTGDKSNPHMAAVATEARKDANTIAKRVSCMEEPDDARLALDIFGKGEVNSLYLKSALIRVYATQGIISDKEATAYWQGMLDNATEGLTSQVHTDVKVYADQRWRDKTYGRNDIARRRLERTQEAFGSRVVSRSTTPPRGA